MIRCAYITLHLALIGALGLAALLTPARAEEMARVVTLGGSITEIAVALGAEDRLVARDTTSTWPETVLDLQDVGYIRALSAEGVLSVAPDLIIAEGDAGPPETVEVLRAAGVPFLLMPEATTPQAVVAKVLAVGAALELPDEARALATRLEAELAMATARASLVSARPRVLFLLSLQSGRVMAGGAGTGAEGIIALSGGVNAGTGFAGYKQMTDEAVIAAAPEVILMMDRTGDMAISDADVLAHPALAQTPAASSGRILRMDGMLLLGFGPRTAEAAQKLYDALHPARPAG